MRKRDKENEDEESIATEIDESCRTIERVIVGREKVNIKAYMESLYEVLHVYSPWISHQFIKESVFFFIQKQLHTATN